MDQISIVNKNRNKTEKRSKGHIILFRKSLRTILYYNSWRNLDQLHFEHYIIKSTESPNLVVAVGLLLVSSGLWHDLELVEDRNAEQETDGQSPENKTKSKDKILES